MDKIIKRVATLVGISAFLGLFGMTRMACALDVGDKMPDFSLQASDGKTYTLEEFHGKKPVVIAFFPKAFTQG